MKIGITEQGDAGLDLSWSKEMDTVDWAVIISKDVGAEGFIEELLKHKEKVILHATVTGYGGSLMEPNVPHPNDAYRSMQTLLAAGFPVAQVVLRVDPIIPTQRGLSTAKKVLTQFNGLGIKRCRVSMLDMYPHVRKRFEENFQRIPYESFTASEFMKKNMISMLEEFRGIYEFEACAESLPFARGCISHKDMDTLGIQYSGDEHNPFKQRKSCLCMAGKTELLSGGKHRCRHSCLYCYWKD